MLRFGPGLLVAAAFIGPGTVTTTSVAGAEFGFALLASGVYRFVDRTLIVLVAVMSAVFLLTMMIVNADIRARFRGLLWPSIPADSLLPIIAVIGTTVVPYNLFLHCSCGTLNQKHIPMQQALRECRVDTVASMSLGGLVTLAVVTTAATVPSARGVPIGGAAAMAQQLEPLLGHGAKYFFATGLFCAGINSAVTAPLAWQHHWSRNHSLSNRPCHHPILPHHGHCGIAAILPSTFQPVPWRTRAGNEPSS